MKACLILVAMLFGTSALADVEPIQEIFSPEASAFPSETYGKVAVVAWVSDQDAPLTTNVAVAEAFKAQNRAALAAYIREAASNGAQLIVTPEFGVVGYPNIPELPSEEDNFQSPEQIAPYAEPVPGVSSKFFAALARELKVYIQFGMAEMSSPGHYHNTAVVVGPNGKVVATYRKMHLFHIEESYLEPGTSPTTYQTPFGKIGILICSDVYSSRVDDYRALNVDALTLSTSWAQFNTGWGMFTSVARQNGLYLLAANQTYFPDSGVIGPDGVGQSHIRQSSGVAYGYLPKVAAAIPARKSTAIQGSTCERGLAKSTK